MDVELLKTCVEYRDGGLYWTKNRLKGLLGTRVGTLDRQGYRYFHFKGSRVKEHRAIFYLLNGTLPPAVDHVNGDVSDNRIENLRPCSIRENARNSGPRKGKLFKGI